MKKEKIFGILIVLLIVLIVLITSFMFYLFKNNRVINSSIDEEVIVNKLSMHIENIEVVENSFSSIKVGVTNNSGRDLTFKDIKLTFKDSEGSIIATTFIGYSGKIKSKSTIEINTSMDIPLNDVYFVDYEVVN